MDLVNRLQARLDEEEFGMVDTPVVPATTTTAAETETSTSATMPLDGKSSPLDEVAAGAATVVGEGTGAVDAESEPTETTEEVLPAITTAEKHDPPKVLATASEASTTTTITDATTTTTTTASTATTGSTMVIPKITPDILFEEKRRIRAARFNMPLVADASKKMKPKVVAQKADTKSTNTNINSNIKRGPTNHVNVAEHDGGATKKQKLLLRDALKQMLCV